jgi:hypothetical protein
MLYCSASHIEELISEISVDPVPDCGPHARGSARRQIKLDRGVGALAVGVAAGSIGQVDRRGKQANHTCGLEGGDTSIRLLSVCSDG